jgi:hypothetical protein
MEGEGSVQMTSLFELVQIGFFSNLNIIYLFYKISYLNEEVNCIPWLEREHIFCCGSTKANRR